MESYYYNYFENKHYYHFLCVCVSVVGGKGMYTQLYFLYILLNLCAQTE